MWEEEGLRKGDDGLEDLQEGRRGEGGRDNERGKGRKGMRGCYVREMKSEGGGRGRGRGKSKGGEEGGGMMGNGIVTRDEV